MNEQNRLQFFPVSFFSIVMGLTGLAIAWHKAVSMMEPAAWVSDVLLVLAAAVFLTLLMLFVVKLARYPDAVKGELNNPIHINFFPTISISLLLLSIALLEHWPSVAHGLWIVGALLHLGFTFYVMSVWIHHEHFEIAHINPAWFIPIVGNVIVPITGVSLGYQEISWFFFSIGIFFWIILMTIIFYRVLFHQPLPDRLMPTFFILIAPPAVGFIAYSKLNGDLDNFGRVLYYTGLFFTLLMMSQIRRFTKLDFYLSWWAYSFPLAAITIATFLMHGLTGERFLIFLAQVLLAIVSVVITWLAVKTIAAIRRRGVCLPTH